jgi:hypothetical protein
LVEQDRLGEKEGYAELGQVLAAYKKIVEAYMLLDPDPIIETKELADMYLGLLKKGMTFKQFVDAKSRLMGICENLERFYDQLFVPLYT